MRICVACHEFTPTLRDSKCSKCWRPSRGADYQRNRRVLLDGNPRCVYCPRPATTADHVVPVAEGGSDDLSNLQPACERCNKSKGDRLRPKPAAQW